MKNIRFTRIVTAIASVAAATAAFGPTHAHADDANVCIAPHEIDKYGLLRRLSLDLRGTLPTVEEYEALDKVDSVPDAVIDSYIASDEFRAVMRRYHEAMFWPNVSNVKLHGLNPQLSAGREKVSGALRIAAPNRAKNFRGNTDSSCGDFEQKHFDPAFPGEYRPDPKFIQTDAMGNKMEGWRMVSPYWDPANPVKVCAFDAQETLTVKVKGNDLGCNDPLTNNDVTCGCGPSLEYCFSSPSDKMIHDAFREQLGRSVDKVATGAKYTDLILSTEAEQNGPLAFWQRRLAITSSSGSGAYTVPNAGDVIAKVDDFTAVDTWQKIDRGAPHAGVLTLPGYMLRFMTNRGRANRFRIDFLGQYFVPPDHLDPAPGCKPDDNDLTQRCNCQYCHATLEPLAAYFAGFAEAGTTRMTKDAGFPHNDPTCVGKTTGRCARFYVTAADQHNPGELLALQFSDVHPELSANADAGPGALAQQIIADGSFAQAAVKKMVTFFWKRDAVLDGSIFDEQPTVDDLTKSFQSNYDVRDLIKTIVTHRQYRRVR